MSDAIIVAVITGGISLVGIFASYFAATSTVKKDNAVKTALIQKDIEEMKKDIAEHNHYAKLFSTTMPVVQQQITDIKERLNAK